jgi:hypothetical protein
MNSKNYRHQRKRVTWEEVTRKQTKLWPKRNYLNKKDKEKAKHIDIKGEIDFSKP